LKTNLVAVAKDDFGSKLFYGLLFLPFLLLSVIVLKKREGDGDVVGIE
jgi:hypothetical protein